MKEESEMTSSEQFSPETGERLDGGTPPTSLSDKQLKAIDLMVSGKRLNEVADAVEISTVQLWRWRQDHAFQVAFGRARVDAHQARVERFWNVVDSAMDAAMESLAEGDPKMSIDVLRLASRGLTDLSYVRADQPDSAGAHEAASPNPPLGEGQTVSEALNCPDCELQARSATGLANHRRRRHDPT
jgi:hypothetical protein